MIFRNRVFSLIDFSTSHNQFLFRALKNGEYKKNMDILFDDVSYIELPLTLENFNLSLGNDEEKKSKLQKIGFDNKKNPSSNLYILESKSKIYFIVAGKASYLENDFAGEESSIPIKLAKPITNEDILRIVNEGAEKGSDFILQKYNKTEWIVIK